MDDIWQSFHRLPRAIRDGVATPSALATVDRLERKFPGLDLAGFIMRAMVKEFPVAELPAKIAAEAKLSEQDSQAVSAELRSGVFVGLNEYLGLPASPTPAPKPAAPIPPPPVMKPTPIVSPKPVSVPPSPVVPPVPVSPRPLIAPPAPLPPAPPAPKPLTNAAPTQNYSDEDDQEIAQQTRRVKTIAMSAGTIDIDELAAQVMRQHNLAFREELLQKRATSLFKARLKGIRDSDDTKAMLMRAPKVGGLGLDPDVSANVAASLDQAATHLKSRGAVRPPEPIPVPPPPAIPKIQAERPAPRPPLTRGLPPANLPTAPAAAMPSVTDQPRTPPPLRRPADIPPPPPLAPPAPATRPATITPTSRPLVTRERQPERQTMSDITRPTVAAMGPAGEMSSMTLMEWRRLGQGAADSASRLIEKLHHFQKESFTLWAEAINGWRQSEVYRLYLDMGRQSLDQGQPISQVIQQRAASGLPYLSEHEFATLSDMNRQLQL